jgi:hypothetical protein
METTMSRAHMKMHSLAIFSGLMVISAIYTEAQSTYTTKDPRPLYGVVQSLEQHYGWRITYEDPPLENPAELQDVTSQAYRALHPDLVDAVLVPVAHPFTFTWQKINAGAGSKATLDECVQQHNDRSENPGRFRTYQQGSIAHVLAAEVRRKDGSMATVSSPLDIRISFSVQERTLYDTVLLILNEVKSSGGTPILLGMAPPAVMMKNISLGARDLTARDALIMALNASDAKAIEAGNNPVRMSWALLYQADEHDYYLNLHPTYQKTNDMLIGEETPYTQK